MSTPKSRSRIFRAKQIGFLPNSPFPANSGNPPQSIQPPSPPPNGFNDMIKHTQNLFGMFNQLSPLMNNLAPMLRLLQGFNIGGIPIAYERTIHPSKEMGMKLKGKERYKRKKRR